MKKMLFALTASTAFIIHAAPQAAIDACRSLNSGSSCHVHTPKGALEGICRQPPREELVICVPANERGQRSNERETVSTQGARNLRKHTIVQSDGVVDTVKADIAPITDSMIDVTVEGDLRILTANGVSKHLTGTFPNKDNPNPIETQTYEFKIPAYPQLSGKIVPLGLHDFGLGVNGVPFDPGAAEWYLGNRSSGWQYEAMSGAISLGLDENHAHVQPTGAYHYHGLPSFLITRLSVNSSTHSPLIGWAADGFPIYALYGYKDADAPDSAIVEMHSSYRLKAGERPKGGNNPGGYYDGTFVADYEYVPALGELDECNGRMTRTPEFPQGTYAYFLTEAFPIIPRCYKGTPSTDFTQQRIR